MNRTRLLIGLGAAGFLVVGLVLFGMGDRRRSGSPPGGPAVLEALPGRADAGPMGDGETRVLWARAETARIEKRYAEAKPLYREVLQRNPEVQVASAAQERLGEVNVRLILSPVRTPESQVYTIQRGDTLSKIAREQRLTVDLLKQANGLSRDLIRVGQTLTIPKAQFSVIVDKSQNSLTLKDGEEVFKVYRCSTGVQGITPVGQFRIVNRLKDPAWKGVVPPGDPANPLGARWLGFDLPEYGIHGTNEPETIGKPVTQGCVRLINADAEELYTLLPEGTQVTIVE